MLLHNGHLLAMLFSFVIPAIYSTAAARNNDAVLPIQDLSPPNRRRSSSFDLNVKASPVLSIARQRAILENISTSSEAFALEMFVKILELAVRDKRDFIISPFAVWSLLMPLSEGATGNTLEELRNVLHLKGDERILRDVYRWVNNYLRVETSTIQVFSMQALFTDINQPVNQQFADVVDNEYGANLIPIDFHDPVAAANFVNEEVRNATHSFIPYAILPQDLKDANFLLMSLLYFKGQWKSPFKVKHTALKEFHDEDGKVISNVNMMTQTGNFNYTGMNELQAHVLELPYGKEDRLSMLIILPQKGVPLTTVAHNLQKIGTGPILAKLQSDALPFEEEKVEVHFPKFSTTSSFNLNVILTDMGIRDLFLPDRANLSKISPNLFVRTILHRTKIIVDEEGTTTASVLSAVLANKASPTKFQLNRPFMYLIVEKRTNSLLFCGHYINPPNATSQ